MCTCTWRREITFVTSVFANLIISLSGVSLIVDRRHSIAPAATSGLTRRPLSCVVGVTLPLGILVLVGANQYLLSGPPPSLPVRPIACSTGEPAHDVACSTAESPTADGIEKYLKTSRPEPTKAPPDESGSGEGPVGPVEAPAVPQYYAVPLKNDPCPSHLRQAHHVRQSGRKSSSCGPRVNRSSLRRPRA